jgi:hypothetical protein
MLRSTPAILSVSSPAKRPTTRLDYAAPSPHRPTSERSDRWAAFFPADVPTE